MANVACLCVRRIACTAPAWSRTSASANPVTEGRPVQCHVQPVTGVRRASTFASAKTTLPATRSTDNAVAPEGGRASDVRMNVPQTNMARTAPKFAVADAAPVITLAGSAFARPDTLVPYVKNFVLKGSMVRLVPQSADVRMEVHVAPPLDNASALLDGQVGFVQIVVLLAHGVRTVKLDVTVLMALHVIMKLVSVNVFQDTREIGVRSVVQKECLEQIVPATAHV